MEITSHLGSWGSHTASPSLSLHINYTHIRILYIQFFLFYFFSLVTLHQKNCPRFVDRARDAHSLKRVVSCVCGKKWFEFYQKESWRFVDLGRIQVQVRRLELRILSKIFLGLLLTLLIVRYHLGNFILVQVKLMNCISLCFDSGFSQMQLGSSFLFVNMGKG